MLQLTLIYRWRVPRSIAMVITFMQISQMIVGLLVNAWTMQSKQVSCAGNFMAHGHTYVDVKIPLRYIVWISLHLYRVTMVVETQVWLT